MEGRRKVASAWRWLSTSKGVGRGVGKSASLALMLSLRPDAEPIEAKWMILCCREKSLARTMAARTPNRLRWSGREYQGDRANYG